MGCALTDKVSAILAKYNALCGITPIAPTDLCYGGGLVTFMWNQLTALPLNAYPPSLGATCSGSTCYGIYVETVTRPSWTSNWCGTPSLLNDFYNWIDGIQIWGKFNVYQVGGHSCSVSDPFGVCDTAYPYSDFGCDGCVVVNTVIAPRNNSTVFSVSYGGYGAYSSVEMIATDVCANTTGRAASCMYCGGVVVAIATAECFCGLATASAAYGTSNILTTGNCVDSPWGIAPNPTVCVP